MPKKRQQKESKTPADILMAGVRSVAKKNSKLFMTLNAIVTDFDSDKKSGFDVWEELNKQIGKHDGDELQSFLVKIRDQFVEDFISHEKNRLDLIFKNSEEKGTQEWLMLITISISRFNDYFQARFSQIDFPFHETYIVKVDEVKTALFHIINNCWGDAYPVIEYLCDLAFISVDIKVHLLVILGEIQQHHFYKNYKADTFFHKAEVLSPDQYRLLIGRAYYFLGLNDLIKSRKYFERFIELYPYHAVGYYGIAEILEMKGDKSSESWYKKAIENAPGEVSSYLKLMRYFIKKDAKAYEKEISNLRRRALQVSPDSEYSIFMETGLEFSALKQYEIAIEYYQKAVSVDRNLAPAYSEMGYTYLIIGGELCYEKARENFIKVVDLLPGSATGYWAMAYAYDEEGDYTSALEWYKKCPVQVNDNNDRTYAKTGEAFMNLNDVENAEMELKKAFKSDRQSEWAKVNMERLAQQCYEKNDDMEKAIDLYNEVLENIGDSYKASYENRIGNLRYFFSEYDKAAGHYKKAIAYDPEYLQFQKNLSIAYNSMGNNSYREKKIKDAIKLYKDALKFDSTYDVYYDNLAKAYEEDNDFENALKQVQKAREINPGEEYETRIKLLKVKKDLLPRFGKKNLKMIPMVTPIAIEVSANLVPLLSTGNELTPDFQSLINEMRDEIQNRFGHERIPGIRIRGNETDLADGTYIIMLDEIPIVSGNVRLDWLLCNSTVDRLVSANIRAEETRNPANGNKCAWLPVESEELVKEIGLRTWDAAGYIMLHLFAVICKNMTDFVSVESVTRQLHDTKYYNEIADILGGVPRFTNILKGLVEEEVPIRELTALCEIYIDLATGAYPSYVVIEEIRNHSKIRPSLLGNQGTSDHCLVYELGDEIVKIINRSILTTGDGALLAIEPEPTQEILSAFRNEVSNLPPESQNPIIMTKDWKIRRHVKKLVELEFPYLTVMAEREIMKKTKTLATIRTN